jgi:hypothetical protein
MAETSEHDLQVQVLKLLNGAAKRDLYWFAVPNAGRRSLRTGALMKAEGLRAGVADLCIMLPEGRTCWLELKKPGNYQTLEQKGFEARCFRLGHSYAVVKSLQDAAAILQGWGVLR